VSSVTVEVVRAWRRGLALLNARWSLRTADSVGRWVRLRGRPVITNRGRLVIGERAQLYSTVATLELVTEEEGTLEIGARTLVNFGTSIVATKSVRIGDNCQIGTHTLILDNDYHRIEPERRLERPPSKPVVIENNVWIGARVIVLPGVTIGADSAIGAGSVVTADIPPRTLAAGIPARPIRQL
jgi:maltose O-acetyltransferase